MTEATPVIPVALPLAYGTEPTLLGLMAAARQGAMRRRKLDHRSNAKCIPRLSAAGSTLEWSSSANAAKRT